MPNQKNRPPDYPVAAGKRRGPQGPRLFRYLFIRSAAAVVAAAAVPAAAAPTVAATTAATAAAAPAPAAAAAAQDDDEYDDPQAAAAAPAVIAASHNEYLLIGRFKRAPRRSHPIIWSGGPMGSGPGL